MLRLKEVRENKGISQAAVARALSISRQGYGYYESGQRTPSTKVLRQLADYFGVSTDYLLGQSPDLASRVPPQYIDANTSAIDKAFGNIIAQEAAVLSGKILASKDEKKISLTLELLERLSVMEHEQLETLRNFLRTIK